MIICTNCQEDNEIGRVFCSECGAKLDLAHISSDLVTESLKQSWIQKHWPKLAIGAGVVVLLIISLAFVPYTDPLGDAGDYTTKRRMLNQLRIFSAAPKGSTRSSRITESDINSYLRLEKAEKMGVKSVSVLIRPEVFSVRVIKPLFDIKISSMKIAPPISQSIICSVFDGRVVVAKASLGHLKLVGPAKKALAKSVYKLISEQKEYEPFKNLIDIKAEEGTFFIKTKK